jgi:hypothetical protein
MNACSAETSLDGLCATLDLASAARRVPRVAMESVQIFSSQRAFVGHDALCKLLTLRQKLDAVVSQLVFRSRAMKHAGK